MRSYISNSMQLLTLNASVYWFYLLEAPSLSFINTIIILFLISDSWMMNQMMIQTMQTEEHQNQHNMLQQQQVMCESLALLRKANANASTNLVGNPGQIYVSMCMYSMISNLITVFALNQTGRKKKKLSNSRMADKKLVCHKTLVKL